MVYCAVTWKRSGKIFKEGMFIQLRVSVLGIPVEQGYHFRVFK